MKMKTMPCLRWMVRAVLLVLFFAGIPLVACFFVIFALVIANALFPLQMKLNQDQAVLLSALAGLGMVFALFWIDAKSTRFKSIKQKISRQLDQLTTGSKK